LLSFRRNIARQQHRFARRALRELLDARHNLQTPKAREERMSILVVDDTEEVRDIFEAVLAEGGYEDVITADSAEAAFALLALDAPLAPKPMPLDLVFLDVVMPGIDGLRALAEIRRDSRYADVPIIMTTSVDDLASVDKAFANGATGYLTKPLKVVDLMACVRANMRLKADLDRRNALERELMQHVPFRFVAN
jgi:CheY-like chemotaxis protein